METGILKTLVAALLLPPAGPLLLAALGLGLAIARRRMVGAMLGLAALAGLWLLSCHAVALALAGALLPAVAPIAVPDLAARRVQAVVVLGGGVLPDAPEYGQAQPSANTFARLRYGLRLARATGLPLAFSGGVGWSAAGTGAATEAEVAVRVAAEEWGEPVRWHEGRSRDTAGNAREMGALLRPQGIERVALVTDGWHLPRATLEFERAGFEVLAAPTGLLGPREQAALEWLPSGHGLATSRHLLREWLALWLATRRTVPAAGE